MQEVSNEEKQKNPDLFIQQKENTSDMEGEQVRPWVRYWARYFDIQLFGLVLGILLGIINPKLMNIIDSRLLGMVLLFFWIIFEAILLSTCGTTPGKFLLKIKVRDKNHNKLSFPAAFARSVGVWFAGMGIGFPLATLITLIVSYNKLKNDRITRWDYNGEFIVLHGKIGVLRTLLTIFILVLYLALIIYGNIA